MKYSPSGNAQSFDKLFTSCSTDLSPHCWLYLDPELAHRDWWRKKAKSIPQPEGYGTDYICTLHGDVTHSRKTVQRRSTPTYLHPSSVTNSAGRQYIFHNNTSTIEFTFQGHQKKYWAHTITYLSISSYFYMLTQDKLLLQVHEGKVSAYI